MLGMMSAPGDTVLNNISFIKNATYGFVSDN